MNRNYIIVFIIALSLSINGFAQVRKYSNSFLDIGVGARALGMSNSYITSVNDVTAGYWNPAGLLGLGSQYQGALMHYENFGGLTKYDYGAYAMRLDSSSVFGVSLIRSGVDNIPNTTELIDANGNIDYNRITYFSAVDFAFIASYAKTMKIPGLRVGANVKVIRRKIGDFAGAWGFGLDAGAQYDYKKWKFAVMARDVTTTFNAWTYNLSDEMKAVFNATGNVIPENSLEITLPKILMGSARKFDFTPKISLLAEVDFDAIFGGKENVMIQSNAVNIDPHFGLEASYMNLIFLRAGLGNYYTYLNAAGASVQKIQPNIGVGVKIKAVTIDYALADVGSQVVQYSNVFSIKVDINKKRKL